MIFDKRQTNIAKGVAILLLLWHHLFLNVVENYNSFISLFTYKNVLVECYLADFCKVCVAMFVVLSGFGLYKSYQKKSMGLIWERDYKGKVLFDLRFVKNHLLKLLFGFWIIYIIFVPLSYLFGESLSVVYHQNFLYGVIDFLGLAALFKTPTINPTWWFMSTIILYYLLFPLFLRIFQYSKELLVVIAAVLMISPFKMIDGNIINYIFPFVVGMYLAHISFFEKADTVINSTFKRLTITLGALIVTAVLKHGNTNLDTVLAISIICFCFLVLSKIPIVNTILEKLGEFSSMIFMFHTFIYDLYFKDFIYGFNYSLLIYIVFVLICFIIAFVIDKIKKLTKYDLLIKKCTYN